jgi:vacuolar iron transporter family protein
VGIPLYNIRMADMHLHHSPHGSDHHAHTPHTEEHFTSSEVVRDIVIGMSDGLTVPFALAAGLTGAVSATHLVVTAGIAEIAAGSIAMGLGGYLAAKSEAEHYRSERRREEDEIIHKPHAEIAEVQEVFEEYGLTKEEIAPIIAAFQKNPTAWADFMMRFELGLEKPDPKRALQSAFFIAIAYIIGGLVPLLPYMFAPDNRTALTISATMTLLALAVFGFVKGRFTGANPLKSAWQTTLIGGIAATAAFFIARLVGG